MWMECLKGGWDMDGVFEGGGMWMECLKGGDVDGVFAGGMWMECLKGGCGWSV